MHKIAIIIFVIVLSLFCININVQADTQIKDNSYKTSEDNCVIYSSDHLKIIGTESSKQLNSMTENALHYMDGCNYIVDKMLNNGSGFHLDKYSLSDGNDFLIQRFVLIK